MSALTRVGLRLCHGMRKSLTLTLLLIATLAAAAPISREAARGRVCEFLSGRAAGHVRRNDIRAVITTAASRTDVEPYYVFNVGAGGGFVIASGDDTMMPILAYADKGSIDPANLPPSLKAWLKGYADEVAWLQRRQRAPATVPPPAASARSDVAPPEDSGGVPQMSVRHRSRRFVSGLLTTVWNQAHPYNLLCPTSVTGRRSVTGCVATAMAQVMKFHEWPRAALVQAVHGGYDVGSSYVAGPAVAAGTRFDWSRMRASYDANASLNDGSEEAVAQLMLACGVAVETWYHSVASGAVLRMAASALRDYFDYASSVRYLARNDYSYQQWLTLMYLEVANGRPVLYGGQSSGGGHAFVIDGYDGSGFFHVNWGWGGDSDGFYALSVLNPDSRSGIGASATADGYTMHQDAIIGIWPDDSARPYVDTVTADDASAPADLELVSCDVTAGRAVAGKPFELTCRVRNNGDAFAGQLFLQNGNDFIPYDGYGTSSGQHISIPAGGVAEVTFRLVSDVATALSLSLWTDLTRTDGSFAQFRFNVDENMSAPLNDMNFLYIRYDGSSGNNTLRGDAIGGRFTVRNDNSTLDFDDDVSMVWYFCPAGQNTYGYLTTEEFHIHVPAGEECSFTFSITGLAPGSYMPFIMADGIAQTNGWDDVCTLQAGAMAYHADGTTSSLPLGSHLTLGADIVAADLRGVQGVQGVTVGNPNTIIVISQGQTAPSGAPNIVCNGRCSELRLTDGYPFGTPVDFTASRVSYTRTFATGYSRHGGGWTSIVLPFDVSTVTADIDGVATQLDWFRSNGDHGKRFWVMAFCGEDDGQVHFTHAEAMQANTPYLIAVLDSEWGRHADLTNRPLRFEGGNAAVSATLQPQIDKVLFTFYGSYARRRSARDCFGINSAGTQFEYNDAAMLPFRAYLLATDECPSYAVVAFDFVGGIANAVVGNGHATFTDSSQTATKATVYDLAGRRVATSAQGIVLSPGVYLTEGRCISVRGRK